MDYEKYLNLIEEGKVDEAVALKSSSMQGQFFKYVLLRENDEDLNEKKFKILRIMNCT